MPENAAHLEDTAEPFEIEADPDVQGAEEDDDEVLRRVVRGRVSNDPRLL